MAEMGGDGFFSSADFATNSVLCASVLKLSSYGMEFPSNNDDSMGKEEELVMSMASP